MTVKELIEKLKEFDENLYVAISDSEYGTDIIDWNPRIEHKFWLWDGPNHTEVDILVIG